MKILARFKEYRKQRQWKRLLKQNEWGGLIPGDIVEYKGRKLMYRGINKNGGPGMPGQPEPMFGSAHPSEPESYYYLRATGQRFPENVFGENAEPAQAGSTGIFISFLNAVRSDLQKVGHITPEQWADMAAIRAAQ
ncbi:MAG: hypothetical protein ABIJ19_01750 [Patescibacteria group bacterium]